MRPILILLCMVSHVVAFDWQANVNSGDFTDESHPGTDPVAEGNVRKSGGNVGFIKNGNWIKFSDFDFGAGTSRFWIHAAKDNTTNSSLEIRTGSQTGPVLGSVAITDTDGWDNYTRIDLTLPNAISGVQDLYLTFSGGGGYLFNLGAFGFHQYRFDAGKDIPADSFSSESHPGDDAVIRRVSGQLQNIRHEAWASYPNFQFGNGVSYLWIEAAAVNSGGTVELRQGGHNGNLIGSIQIPPTGGMASFKPIGLKLAQPLQGVQDLCLKFTGGAGDLFNLRKFRFQRLAPDYKATNMLPAWEKPVLQRLAKSAGAFTSESHPNDPNKVRSDTGQITYISNATWAGYQAFDFGTNTNFFSILGASAAGGGSLQILLDGPNGTPVGSVAIPNTGGWGNYREFTTNLTQSVSGVRDVYFKFSGGGGSLFNVASFRFQNVGAGAKSYGRIVAAAPFDQESHPDQNTAPVLATGDRINTLTDASWVAYQNFDFGAGSNLITLEAATPGKGGAVEVRLGSATGTLLTSIDITHTGSWTHDRPYTGRFNQSINGTHDLYLKFVDRFDAGGNLFELKSFVIGRDEMPTAPTTEGSIHVYPPVPGLADSPYYTYSVQKVSALDAPLKQNATNWLSPFAWFTECVEQGVAGVSSAYFDEFIGGWSHTYCNFEMDRNTPIVVKITRKNVTGAPSGPIFMANAHPAHKVMSCEIINGDVYVTMREPALVTIDIDGQLDTRDAPRAIPDVWGGNYVPYKGKMNGAHAVSIFANPVIPDKPSPTGPGVRAINPGDPLPAAGDDNWTTLYFKPGIHNFSVDANGVERPPLPGDAHTVRSGKSYYFPGDTIVYGNFDDGGDSSERKDVRFFGHGTLSGSKIRHWAEYPEEERVGRQFRMISIGSGRNCHFEGITLADPAEHGLYVHNFNGAHHRVQNSMRWLKNISWRVNNDTGSVTGGVLEDCFFRHQDDGVYLGGNDLRRCVFWSDVNGATFRMSFALRDKAPEVTTMFPRNVVVEDCDVIYSRGMFSFSHDTASGVIGVPPDNASSYSDGTLNTGQHLVFRNVRYTDPRPLRNFFGMDIGDPSAPGLKAWAGVRFENVESRHPQTWGWKNHLIGYPNAPIHHLYFNRVSVDGRSLNETSLADTSRFNTSNLSNLVFIEPPGGGPLTYDLMTSSTNGSIVLNPPGGVYPAGTEVEVSAVPNSGYRFTSWGGALSGSVTPATIVMDGSKSVSATFTANITNSTVDTTGGTTVLDYDAPGNKYIGNGTLRISNDGSGSISLGTGVGSTLSEFAMTSGGMITIDSGVTFVNGGWQKAIWTHNKADLQVNGTFDVTDGNPVYVNALNGAGPIILSWPWNSRATELHIGMDGGGGVFSGSIQEPHWAGSFVRIVKNGSGTQTFDNPANQKPKEIVINAGWVNLSSATDVTMSSDISGAGGLRKSGAGVLTLSGVIGNTGPISIEEGTLKVNSTLNQQSNLVVVNGALLDLGFSAEITVASLALGSSGPLLPGIYSSSHPTLGSFFVPGAGSLRIAGTNYEVWAGTHALGHASAGADFDADGVVNLLEYVLNGDPRQPGTHMLPSSMLSGEYLDLTFKRSDASEADATLIGEWSTNLADWSATDVTMELISENGPGADDMRLRIPVAKQHEGRLYGRLRATRP